MPMISRFHGITVYMNFSDHNSPHFHARHGGHEATVAIGTWVVTGDIGHGALQPLLDWAARHVVELWDNRERARARRPLCPIAPPP